MLDRLKEHIGDAGGYAELRWHANHAVRLMMRKGTLLLNDSSRAGGVSARCYRNGAFGFASLPGDDAAAITKAALEGSCELSRATLDMFCAILGSVAGNLAVTFGARGGVYIAGGIVPRFPEFLAASAFRARFEAKGRFQDYLRNIPTRLVTKPDASFVGLKMFADHNLD